MEYDEGYFENKLLEFINWKLFIKSKVEQII